MCELERIQFSWRKLLQIAYKTVKFTKVFSLESFPLYGIPPYLHNGVEGVSTGVKDLGIQHGLWEEIPQAHSLGELFRRRVRQCGEERHEGRIQTHHQDLGQGGEGIGPSKCCSKVLRHLSIPPIEYPISSCPNVLVMCFKHQLG